MNFTTKEIIKLIPLDNELRTTLLREYDSYGEGKKYEISIVCWDIFAELTDTLAQIKFKQYLFEVETNKRRLTTNLMEISRKAVLQDYEDMLSGKKYEQQEIESLREKLKSLSNIVQ